MRQAIFSFMKRLLLPALVLGLMLPGCGSSGPDADGADPEAVAVAEQFSESQKKGDFDSYCETLSPPSQVNLLLSLGMRQYSCPEAFSYAPQSFRDSIMKSTENSKLTRVRTSGQTGYFLTESSGKTLRKEMIEIDGRWYVHILPDRPGR